MPHALPQVREKLRIEEGLAAERAAADAAKAAGLDGIADADAADCCGGGGCGSGASPDAHQQQPLGDGGFLAPEEGGAPEAAPQRRKPPKIFYATRTHSQIAQVGAAAAGRCRRWAAAFWVLPDAQMCTWPPCAQHPPALPALLPLLPPLLPPPGGQGAQALPVLAAHGGAGVAQALLRQRARRAPGLH